MPETTIDWKTRPYYARPGDTVSCTNGHDMAEFVTEVRIGQPIESSHAKWNGPQSGEYPYLVCGVCGADFSVGNSQGWRVTSIENAKKYRDSLLAHPPEDEDVRKAAEDLLQHPVETWRLHIGSPNA